MDSKVIIAGLVVGYFYAGLSAVLKIFTTPLIDRPAPMMHPNNLKCVLWAVCWPIHTFRDAYRAHMPNKPLGLLYGIFSIPCLWLGFAIMGQIALYPYRIIDTWIFAFAASIVTFYLAFVILMPLVAVLSTILVVLCVAPFKLFIPKSRA